MNAFEEFYNLKKISVVEVLAQMPASSNNTALYETPSTGQETNVGKSKAGGSGSGSKWWKKNEEKQRAEKSKGKRPVEQSGDNKPKPKPKAWTYVSTGFMVEVDGEPYVVTTAHSVPSNRESLEVEHPGGINFNADVVFLRNEIDLALLTLKEPVSEEDTSDFNFEYIDVSSNPPPPVGTNITIIGHPMELHYSCLRGQLAASNPRVVGKIIREGVDKEIDHDKNLEVLHINNQHGLKGISGGPIFDEPGNLIGMMSFILYGYDFGIPVRTIKMFLGWFLDYKKKKEREKEFQSKKHEDEEQQQRRGKLEEKQGGKQHQSGRGKQEHKGKRSLESFLQSGPNKKRVLDQFDVKSGIVTHVELAEELLLNSFKTKIVQNSLSKAAYVNDLKEAEQILWAGAEMNTYGGGPTLTDSDICINCLMDGANTIVRSDDYWSRREAMREIAEDAHAGKTLAGTLYYVSKSWLSQWLRRKHVDFPCEADVGPTASIRCPHGELLPEQAAGAKRVLVPECLWLFLVDTANTVKPDEPMSCSVFPSESDTCAICSVELTQVACLEDNLRAQKLKQRNNHEKLYLEKKIPLSPDSKYYMLPSSWLTKWRSYIAASGKNISSSAEPDSLDRVIDLLKCDKHSRLLERPPDLICKRGAIFQKTSPTDGFTIITESDWNFFCEDWEGTEWDGISAEIEFSNGGASKVVGSCEDMPISEAHLGSSKDELNDELESRGPIIKTVPEVCEECVGEKESHKLVEKLQYSNEDICVYFVRGKEVPKSILEASQAISESDCRISKRSRKTSCGNSINLKVSDSTSIYQLKTMIWESFGVVKENQILHKGHKLIEGKSATLADMSIFPGDVLWIKDSEIHENRDIADELSEQKMEIQPTEEGFRGTLLTSNISAQVI